MDVSGQRKGRYYEKAKSCQASDPPLSHHLLVLGVKIW
jgi:hypothetical protein